LPTIRRENSGKFYGLRPNDPFCVEMRIGWRVPTRVRQW
jgi:hypothetical protein